MKFYIIAGLLFVALTAVLAAPIEDVTSQESQESDESHDIDIRSIDDLLSRDKRATCQIGGKLGEWVGDTACAAHCLWLKHLGGYCSGGTCYCNKRIP